MLREQRGQFAKFHPIPTLEPCLADLMLFSMVKVTKADHPSIGGLQPDPAIGPAPDVRTFDRHLPTPRYAAVMPTNPRAVSRAGARIGLLAGAIDPLR